MQCHDQKQAELWIDQWKLVREQTGAFARELTVVQEQIRELKTDSLRVIVSVERFFQDSEAKYAEERRIQQSAADAIEQRFQKVLHDLDVEAKLRAAGFQEVHPKILATEQMIDARTREQRIMEQEVSRLGCVVEGNLQDLCALKESMTHEASARRSQEDSTLEMLRNVREECRQDVHARMVQYDEQWRSHLSVLDVERSDRQQLHSFLQDKIAALEKVLLPQLDEVPVLKKWLSELENSMAKKIKESHKVAEQEIADRMTSQHKLEIRIAELSVFVEKEHSAHAAQTEEYERVLQNFRSKVRGMIAEQADLSRQVREEMQSEWAGQLKQETAMRDAQNTILLDHCTEQRSAMDVRADKLDAAMGSLEQRQRDERAAEVQTIEATHLRHVDAWSRNLREQGELLQGKIAEERRAREAQGVALAGHMDFFDRFYQDLRQACLRTGCRLRPSEACQRGESGAGGASPLRATSPAKVSGASVVV